MEIKKSNIGYRMTFVYLDDELEGECGELTKEPQAYNNIGYIKEQTDLQWIEFDEIEYDIDKRTGRPNLLDAVRTNLKRVYFGEIKKFGELENYQYFCQKELIDSLMPSSLVVVSRTKNGNLETIYPIPTKLRRGKLVPADNIEVLSQADLEKITSIQPLHNSISFMNYVLEGSKKLVNENTDIVKNIVNNDEENTF